MHIAVANIVYDGIAYTARPPPLRSGKRRHDHLRRKYRPAESMKQCQQDHLCLRTLYFIPPVASEHLTKVGGESGLSLSGRAWQLHWHTQIQSKL